jgi:hypothetical protein
MFFRIYRSDGNEHSELLELGRNLQRGNDSLTRSKVHILGDCGSGKTTLVRTMLDLQGKPTSANHVVGVHNATLKGQAEVSIWDHGGHTSCQKLTDLFIKPEPAVFVIVADLTSAIHIQQISRWLTFIKSRMCSIPGRTRVLVVGSHADVVVPASVTVSWHSVKESFKDDVDFISPEIVRLTSTDAVAVGALVQTLIEALSSITRTLPGVLLSSCRQLLALLPELRKASKWCNWPDFVQAAKPALEPFGYSEEKLRVVTRQLASIGELVFCELEGPMKDVVIIDIGVLCGILRAFGTSHSPASLTEFHGKCSRGPLPLAEIAQLTKQSAPNFCAWLPLLEQLKLAYGFEQQDAQQKIHYFLFPHMLLHDQSADLFKPDPTFDVHAGFELTSSQTNTMLLPGLFPRLQVHLCRKFGPGSTAKGKLASSFSMSVFQNGFWCSNGTQALIRFSESLQSIIVHVRSAQQKGPCFDLLNAIEFIILDELVKSGEVPIIKRICSVTHLRTYFPEPYCYDVATIHHARDSGDKFVTGDGVVDAVLDFLSPAEIQNRRRSNSMPGPAPQISSKSCLYLCLFLTVPRPAKCDVARRKAGLVRRASQ